MKTEKIGVKAALKKIFSNLAVKAFILIYLIALAIQLYDSVQNAVFLFIFSLFCFALLCGAVRLTRAIKVEVVPVRRPLVGVVACAMILASWFFVDWWFRTKLIPEISYWKLSIFLSIYLK